MICYPKELDLELKSFGLQQVILLDSQYKTISPQYLKRKLREFEKLYPHEYVAESNDCDDAAVNIYQKLRSAARKNKEFRNFGIPVALLGVTLSITSRFDLTSLRTKHVTNLIKCSDNQWYIYEKLLDEVYSFKEILGNMDYSILHFAML